MTYMKYCRYGCISKILLFYKLLDMSLLTYFGNNVRSYFRPRICVSSSGLDRMSLGF